ncbi:MAG: gamma-glutamyltransferase [Anaerolineae bacterium]|nr:gamma-glutamyltransferase [Anaerolineae bacterium]
MSGVIAAGGPETAAAGAAMLKQGGNAVDAAVAAAFASFIAEIGVVHLGGSGLAHLYDPRNGRSLVYDFFSTTPGLGGDTPGLGGDTSGTAGSHPAVKDFAEVIIDFIATTQSFHLGRASVAVPGNIVGLCQLAADHGRLPLPVLLQPAIKLAREGYLLSPFQAETCALLTPIYTHTPSMQEIFAPHGNMIQAGEKLFIPHLAETLENLAKEGERYARNGRLAQAILADQQKNGGLLTAADLQNYQVLTHDSIRLPYRGYELLLPPPSSTGGILTTFSMKLLAYFDVAQYAHGSAEHLRLLYEVMAATSRARRRWDIDSEQLPLPEAISHFLSKQHVQCYKDEIADGMRNGRFNPGIPEKKGGGNTSHLSVIDGDGLAVSLTTTAGESAGFVVPGTGCIPNNILGEADLHPHGFHTRPAGQRIPSMMTPTIVLKNGKTRLVVGSGGSERIRSAILQVLSNLLDFKMPLHETVNTARVHLENGILQCEHGYNPAAVDQLEKWGYPVNRWPTRSIYYGGAHSVSRTENGRLVAAGDNRRGGSTAVA